jgi:hypothetical protein
MHQYQRKNYLGPLLPVVLIMASAGCILDGYDEPGMIQEQAALDEMTADLAIQAQICNVCPGNMTSYRGQNGFQLECYCPSTTTGIGTVWGTATYTDDSSLCRAAVHAGAITLNGGSIVATVGPGQSSYVGSVSNGVTSFSYGSWAGSYSVSAGSAGECVTLCPGNLTSFRGRNGTEVTCHCSSSATASGNVWGTDMYTDDSALCRAAVHAGVIPLAGGIIHAVIAGGVSSYSGSTRNGVTSLSYGSWVGSYYFQ